MEHQQAICADIVKIVRERSTSAQLVSAEEIRAVLRGEPFLESEDVGPKTHRRGIPEQVLNEYPDIKMISGKDGIPYYFSVLSLSESYAAILIRKSEDPLLMIAEVVRENSRLYPRPVPVDGFRELPFQLTLEEIGECLMAMSAREEYGDITRTVTSVGSLFLFSTRHLEPDHAVALAEWLEVGQIDSP